MKVFFLEFVGKKKKDLKNNPGETRREYKNPYQTILRLQLNRKHVILY